MKPLFFRNIVCGVLCAAISAAVLLCIFAFIGVRLADPAPTTVLFARMALLLSAFIGGRVCSAGCEDRALGGVLCGAVYMLLLLIPSVIFSGWGAESMLFAALTVVASLLGSVLFSGGRWSGKRKRSPRRYGR